MAQIKATLRDAETIATVWKDIPSFTVGTFKLDDFNAIYTATLSLDKDYSEREAELVGLKKHRDDQARQLQEVVTRFRSAARAHFGPDSAQYAQAGGTPASERKPRTRKAKPDAEQAPALVKA